MIYDDVPRTAEALGEYVILHDGADTVARLLYLLARATKDNYEAQGLLANFQVILRSMSSVDAGPGSPPGP